MADNPTLLELAKAMDPNGNIAAIVEVLNQTNEILDDMSWATGNLVTGHRTTIRTGIPQPTWRKFGQGVQTTKSKTAQVEYSCGMLEAFSEVDKALSDLNGNTAAYRLSQARPHMEGFNQEISDTLFYGDESSEPEAFTGLAHYFNDLSTESADNIIDAGGTGTDNASIWLVVWGPETCHGIIPKGSVAGMQHQDLGDAIDENAGGVTGSRMRIYRDHYRWDAGLAVPDWRYVVRICNIDKSLLSTVYTAGAFSTGAHLPELMFQAIERIPSLAMGRPAFYMARDIRTKIRQQVAAATQNSTLDVQTVGGRRVMFYNEVPLRRCDALAADEARVT